MAEPYALGIADAARQIREKQLSPVTLAQSLLRRIDHLESYDALAGPLVERAAPGESYDALDRLLGYLIAGPEWLPP